MHFKRLIFLTTLLTVYVGRILFGQALHLAECSTDHSHCGANTHNQSDDCITHKHSAHLACSIPPVNDNKDRNHDEQNHRHDSANCWGCHVLGETQQATTAIVFATSSQALPLFISPSPVLYLCSGHRTINTRAPPEVAWFYWLITTTFKPTECDGHVAAHSGQLPQVSTFKP